MAAWIGTALIIAAVIGAICLAVKAGNDLGFCLSRTFGPQAAELQRLDREWRQLEREIEFMERDPKGFQDWLLQKAKLEREQTCSASPIGDSIGNSGRPKNASADQFGSGGGLA